VAGTTIVGENNRMRQGTPVAVCVFCGSNLGDRDVYGAATQAFGKLLAERNLTLIYGGGRVGLMGALADAALAAGGRVIGVIPKLLYQKELAHEGVTELRVVESMSERKAVMGQLSDAFVALPGGIGTMDELFEVWTWTQLGLQHKFAALLNIENYFDSLIAFIDHSVAEGFLRSDHRRALLVDTDAEQLLSRLLEATRQTRSA
jgi:uncharacterized protein (TIGR00730 family)